MQEKKVPILKKDKVSKAEEKAFFFQTHYGEPILSFTPRACYYRNINRPAIDDMFAYAAKLFFNDPKKAWEINNQAREAWRKIIRESNNF